MTKSITSLPLYNKRWILLLKDDLLIKLSKSELQRISFVVINEEQAGWRPTKSELLALIKSDRHPSKMIQHDMERLDQQMKHDEAF